MSEYNGHPSYDHWNVTLWIYNDEDMYRTALRACRLCLSLHDAASHVCYIMQQVFGKSTPDGAPINDDLVAYAIVDDWNELNDDDDDDD